MSPVWRALPPASSRLCQRRRMTVVSQIAALSLEIARRSGARIVTIRRRPSSGRLLNGVNVLLNPITVELVSMCRRPVTGALRIRAALHLLDWLGCAIYGLRYLHGKSLLNYLKEVPEGKATALGAGAKHFEQAVRGARRSVSDRDLAQYASFAQTLQQSRAAVTGASGGSLGITQWITYLESAPDAPGSRQWVDDHHDDD